MLSHGNKTSLPSKYLPTMGTQRVLFLNDSVPSACSHNQEHSVTPRAGQGGAARLSPGRLLSWDPEPPGRSWRAETPCSGEARVAGSGHTQEACLTKHRARGEPAQEGHTEAIWSLSRPRPYKGAQLLLGVRSVCPWLSCPCQQVLNR